MDYSIRHLLLGCSAAMLAGSLLTGCASKEPREAAQPQPAATQAAPPVQDQLAAAASGDKPGAAEGELFVLEAKVKAIDKKNRVVTLKYEDGKVAEVKCGPEVRNFPQIRVGDDVKAEFLKTVELFVADTQSEPAATSTQALERAPKGSKPGMVAVTQAEVTATVQAIDYQTRQVTLKAPEGKIIKVTAGPEVKRLNEVKQGDTVVARYTEALSIKVSTPAKK